MQEALMKFLPVAIAQRHVTGEKPAISAPFARRANATS
jgi:hypothetical protein